MYIRVTLGDGAVHAYCTEETGFHNVRRGRMV